MVRFWHDLGRVAALAAAALLMAACAALPPAPATVTVAPATATPAPRPAAATPTAAPPQAETTPAFGPAWRERNIYRTGLIAAEASVLDRFSGASEYRLDLVIDDGYRTLRGHEQVFYTNREGAPLPEIYLRLFPNSMGGEMAATNVTVNGQPVTAHLAFAETALRIPLGAALAPGESLVIALDYTLTVPEDLGTGYGLLSFSDGILALDSPYGMIPVYDESGWQVGDPPANADTSFNDVSFYLVRITAPAALKLVTTGVEVARELHDGRQVATYAAGPARDFYIAASEAYTAVAGQQGETRILSYALTGQEEAAQAALQHAAAALASFSARFGAYPYTELEVAATPMLALGIEYPGVTGITTALYEAGAEMGGRPASVVIESTVAHEAAHQWFYNVVGSDQVDEPWLDEALAQYATSLYFLDEDGAAGAQAYRDTWEGRWERVDRAAIPIGLPAGAYAGREYSAIVYGRGPLFLAELQVKFGEEVFDRFLRAYAARYRWGIATAAGFKQLAEETCGCDLAGLFAEWVYE